MAKSLKKIRSRKQLGVYLAAGAGSLGMVSGTEAAVVSIDLNALGVTGVNGGAAPVSFITPYANSTDQFVIFNVSTIKGVRLTGVQPNMGIAVEPYGNASPKKFGNSQVIGSSSIFTNDANRTMFFVNFTSEFKSPDFGPNSYLGFKTMAGRYGYIEATWNYSTQTFYLISAAYESDIGVAIQTPGGSGGGGGAVPEPASGAIAALLIGGTVLRQWRKKRREETNEAIAS